MKRKYFTRAEFWETISKSKKYDMKEVGEVKEYVYKCCGA